MTNAAGRRLVVVEDEGILALDVARYLTSVGFDVRGVAADSEEAVALVERERPDLVLMDITIQGERDGVEVASELRARFDVPVVFLTAHGDPKTIERAQATEPMGYLLKPFKKPDLGNLVSIALARSHAERRLREREELLQTTLSCIDEAVVTTDDRGSVTWINRAAETLVGEARERVVSQPVADVVRLEHEGAAPLADVVRRVREEGRVSLEGTVSAEGEQRSVVGTAAALRSGVDDFGVVLTLRDLTELLVARRQLEFSERLSAMGTLVAGVAHEVNNPLSVIVSNLSYALQGDLVPPGDLREALAEALDASRRVARIVSDLKAFSRPQHEPLRAMDPREALGVALAFTRSHWRAANVALELELQAVPDILGSSTRLGQVLVNLLINATHVLVDQPGPRVIRVSARTSAAGAVELRVHDNGPGIPEKLRDRVFEPFFTTKAGGKGTGLGLAVSRNIVASHGGALTVEDAPGGATFVVTIPAGPSAAERVRPWVLWAGARTPELEQLLATTRCTVLDEENVTGREELLVIAEPLARARAVLEAHADFEHHALCVSDEPLAGQVTLRRPFDVAALGAFARKREATPG
ncbi:MAG: ATP-binding protein [Myxococcota bacterium]